MKFDRTKTGHLLGEMQGDRYAHLLHKTNRDEPDWLENSIKKNKDKEQAAYNRRQMHLRCISQTASNQDILHTSSRYQTLQEMT